MNATSAWNLSRPPTRTPGSLPGIQGTVRGYSDRPTPTLRVAWDDGSTLSMLLTEGDIVTRVETKPGRTLGDMTPAELLESADRELSHVTHLVRGTNTCTLVEAVQKAGCAETWVTDRALCGHESVFVIGSSRFVEANSPECLGS